MKNTFSNLTISALLFAASMNTVQAKKFSNPEKANLKMAQQNAQVAKEISEITGDKSYIRQARRSVRFADNYKNTASSKYNYDQTQVYKDQISTAYEANQEYLDSLKESAH